MRFRSHCNNNSGPFNQKKSYCGSALTWRYGNNMRKTIFTRTNIISFFICSLLFLFTANNSYAANPSLFFSDMTDGPTTGWEGSVIKGAAVTIWGTNLGNSRGTSSITACGVILNSDSDFAEWGATTNPTTARGLQRITFWLKPSMTVGDSTISVKTAGGTSASIPFHCRSLGTNHIYFISRSGSDSNNGLYSSSTGGSNGSWLSASKVRSLKAGDVAYFRSGIWTEIDNWSAVIDFWNTNHGNGTLNKSITIASYPGELAKLGDSTTPHALGHHGSSGDVLNYWTFSKFLMRASANVTNWAVAQTNSDDHLRFTGNDMSTTAGGKTIATFNGGSRGQTYLYFYGNYVCDAGVNNRGETAAQKGYSFYLGGYGFHNYIYVGWNEFAYNSAGRGMQIYGHTVNDWIDNLYVHDNYIHENSMTGAILGGGDGGGGSYNYEFLRTVYFYNNVLLKNGIGTPIYPGVLVGGEGWGGNNGKYYLYNNTFYLSREGELDVAGHPVLVSVKNNIFYTNANGYLLRGDSCTVCTGNKNLYFGAGNGPVWDSNRIDDTDPQFISANPVSYVDLQIKGTSPAKDAAETISLTVRDFYGVQRPVNAIPDIGAYEYNSDTVDTVRPNSPVIKSIN